MTKRVLILMFASSFIFATEVDRALPDPFESVGPHPITLHECDYNASPGLGKAVGTASVLQLVDGKIVYYNQCAFERRDACHSCSNSPIDLPRHVNGWIQ